MDRNKNSNKGEHERSMEKAKEMIDKGCGMTEIISVTNLTEEDVTKAKAKWIDQYKWKIKRRGNNPLSI